MISRNVNFYDSNGILLYIILLSDSIDNDSFTDLPQYSYFTSYFEDMRLMNHYLFKHVPDTPPRSILKIKECCNHHHDINHLDIDSNNMTQVTSLYSTTLTNDFIVNELTNV